MADTIRIKATDVGEGPKTILTDRVLAFHRNEKALYIGDHRNVAIKLCQAEDVETIKTKLTANNMESMDNLSADATLEHVVGKYNELISALKESGIMKT